MRIQYFQLREWSATRVDRNHQRKIPAHGLNFIYAVDLTKMMLLEMITQRANNKIELDTNIMKITFHSNSGQGHNYT